MHNFSDPDCPHVADPPGEPFVFTCDSAAAPAPFPAAGTPPPLPPPHEFRRFKVIHGVYLWACVRCGKTATERPGHSLDCPGNGDAAEVAPPDPPPLQSLAEARAHCRATLERLAAGECFVPDALAAVEGVAQAVRAECAGAARAVITMDSAALDAAHERDPNSVDRYWLGWNDGVDDVADAIDALDLGGPPE
jgi:hypothetical protein